MYDDAANKINISKSRHFKSYFLKRIALHFNTYDFINRASAPCKFYMFVVPSQNTGGYALGHRG